MNKQELLKYLDNISGEINTLALELWNHPEISEAENRSSDLCRYKLREYGYTIQEIPTQPYAFIAEYGSGSPVIAILGEYDALPGLSQKKDTKFNPVEAGGPGHGCGHNLLGSASLGAALALKKYIDETGAKGTIRYYGCPEEETLAGKVKMIKNGAFEGCDVALSWHPLNVNTPLESGFLANNSIKFRFYGTSAHAAQSPESGRSALDAVELMNIGANYLREHIIDKARVHYTITNAGGAPNIIPKEAESWYYVRAPHRKDVDDITRRLLKIAEGAALMTETKMEYEMVCGCYEMLANTVMFDLTHANMMEIPTPSYTDVEYEFARKIQETLDPVSVGHEREKFISPDETGEIYIHEGVLDKERTKSAVMAGSSDSGDVSWIMPMNLFLTAAWPMGVAAHSWQATSSSGHTVGLKAMQYAAKVFAAVAYDLLNNPQLVADAKAEFEERTKDNKYKCPLGD